MSDASSVPSRAHSPVSATTPDILPTARPYRFTWDPAHRRPGPQSVSGTTDGPGDDFAGPHPLAFLNPSSTSLALGSLPSEWSSSRTGFHAISTVLNSPHKRQAPPKAHSSLPSVPPADLPRVRRKDFESYLRAIGPEWDRYQHNAQLGREGQAQIDDNNWAPSRSSTTDEDSDATPQPAFTPPPMSIQGKYIPPLDSVPKIFFNRDFSLADPPTFATVTEQDPATALRSPMDDSFADPFSLSYSLPLLEKFSHYADTVEQHLVREIFIRSGSFFAALTNLHDLQSESERCLKRITKLRKELQDVDNNSAKRGLEMVRKECKMSNLGKVRDGVKLIGEVVEMTGVAKSLVQAGQWGEALGVVEDIDKLWEGREPPNTATADQTPSTSTFAAMQNGNGHAFTSLPTTVEEPEDISSAKILTPIPKTPLPTHYSISLSSLHAFSALPSHLRTLTMEIAASLSNELVSVLRSDLDARITAEGKPSPDADQGLKDRLKPLLLNLIRTKGLKEGMLSWREVVLGDVRGLVKKIIPDFDPDEDESTRDSPGQSQAKAALATHLRGMRHTDFILLIQRVYRSFLNGVEGLETQGTIIVDLLKTLSVDRRATITNIPAVEEDLADIVSSSAELSNTQAAKVISFRSEQHAQLELQDFLTFFNDSWAFVIKCETICRRMIVGLRGTVSGQARLFLQTFHQARITRSAKLVEDEQWNPAEVSTGLQHIANVLVDSAVRDPPELVIKTDDTIFSPQAGTNFGLPPTPATAEGAPTLSAIAESFTAAMHGSTATTPTPAQTTHHTPTGSKTNGTTSTKHLRIEDRSYYTVPATAEVLTLLLDYLRVVINLSMLTTDTMSRVIEFLKAFNSRTCQVVLGAGAMRSAGLKNITARHLALASQSLSIIFELIPYVRETFRRHLSQKQAVMLVEFDKLKRDYQEHQNEIHAKLVNIMSDRLNAHIRSLKLVDWKVPKPDGGINDYMAVLVKETVTLHRVLSRYLVAPVVEYVLTQVFAAINHRLSEEYAAIELPDQAAKDRLIADTKFLHQSLSALKNISAPTQMLETFVTEKRIGQAGVGMPQPSAASASSSSTTANVNGSPSNNGLMRSNTLSTNQRLKGLMSSTRATFSSSSVNSSSSSVNLPPLPSMANNANLGSGSGLETNRDKALPVPLPSNSNSSSTSRTSTPPPVPPPSDKPGSGFKRFESPPAASAAK